jgi:hypothetical protein
VSEYLELLNEMIRQVEGETWDDERLRKGAIVGLMMARSLYATAAT